MTNRNRKSGNAANGNADRDSTPAGTGVAKQRFPVRGIHVLIVAALIITAASAVFFVAPEDGEEDAPGNVRSTVSGKLTVHWGSLSGDTLAKLTPSEGVSNIRRADYSGAESCRKCHKKNYEKWTGHAHRWMNALASSQTVKGDFSGEAEITYQGARGTFFRDGERFMMRIEHQRGESLYEIHQTLGSRFFQYYIGQGIEGPSPKGSRDFYANEHVLPFGYWLDHKMWVPIVHVHEEDPDEDERWNPLHGVRTEDGNPADLVYANSCNFCHTTFPMADTMLRQPKLIGAFAPNDLLLDMSSYLAGSHPDLWDGSEKPGTVSNEKMYDIIVKTAQFDAREKAASLGISCEACHLGAKAHAAGKLKKPTFSPHGDDLYLTDAHSEDVDTGRSPANVNWACSRCHQGERPQYAGGMATWNSTEFSDAQRGSCYSELTCIHCHDPHKGIGKRWAKTPTQDDNSCLSCHAKYSEADARRAHTHHPAGSSGDRCMNCHMPKINEGMQDAVRTHTIFSPTNRKMLEAAQPNACNLCHRDKPIDWTVKHLREWYGQDFDKRSIDRHYYPRDTPVGRLWLNHDHEATRLAAAEAYTKSGDRSELAELLDLLDDPFLLNRQFTQRGVEGLLGISLDDYGYRFYMSEEERREPLKKLRSVLLSPAESETDPAP